MRHDLFEFNGEMSRSEVTWRVVLLLALIGVLLMDLFLWRPL
jgi:hypothetical protein